VGRPAILKAGLTGGIACGKSTVAGFLGELGASLIDADAIVHDLLAPGGATFDDVVSRFGEEILDQEGRIDRAVLGRIVFSEGAARQALNALVHPRVREAADRQMRAFAERGERIAVYDAALLVETGAHHELDRLIVAHCSAETQLARLRERDGLAENEALARIAAQAPLEEKLALADYLIGTDGSLEETRHRTAEVYRGLVEDYRITFDGC
jgi:dephospho-CoA kinase